MRYRDPAGIRICFPLIRTVAVNPASSTDAIGWIGYLQVIGRQLFEESAENNRETMEFYACEILDEYNPMFQNETVRGLAIGVLRDYGGSVPAWMVQTQNDELLANRSASIQSKGLVAEVEELIRLGEDALSVDEY